MAAANKMPLSAVGMIAAHIFIESIRNCGMYSKELDFIIPGSERSYRQRYADLAAEDAHMLAQAVEKRSEYLSTSGQDRPNPNT